LAGAALVGLLVAFALAVSATIDAPEHEAYALALRQALELDARLDEEVANSRLGVVTHYDGLVRVRDRVASTSRALEAVPAFLSDYDRGTLAAEVGQYQEALEQKLELVERFKTEHAVLRNSMRALPHNTERAIEATGPEHPELAAALGTILERVLSMIVTPDDARARRAHCALAALGEIANADAGCGETEVVEVPEHFAGSVATVRRHAREILERHEAVQNVVASVMALPVATRADELRASYAAMYVDAVERARARWLLVFTFALAFLGLGAAYIIVRQRAYAAILRETKSQLERALLALEVERDREAELAALKSRFVSMTSHEFRTPLSVILSSAELLEAYGEKWNADKRSKHLARIRDSTNTMSRMLDDVLLIGRAEAGMLELKPAPVDLGALAETVIDEIRATVGSERKLAFDGECGDTPAILDEKLLRHVLTNLLSNAFKYSPGDSTVHFSIRRDDDAALFEVRDEGIGIPPEEELLLFDAFHRCSNADTIPGTGLGLAVVKKSVEVHNGTIDVDTKLGEGTCFSVRIPFLSEAA